VQLVLFEEKQIAKNSGEKLPPSQLADRGKGVWLCDANTELCKEKYGWLQTSRHVFLGQLLCW